MNKSQLISTIAENANISVSESEKLLAATLDGIVETLTRGDSVSLVGFGSFGVRKRAARKVRNPQTGNEMLINAAIVPYFKAGKGLKEQVDTSKND